jgi:hypothetical protein
MRRFRFTVAIGLALLASGFAAEAQAGRFWCRGPYVAPTFAYGNVGYAAGYSTAVTRWGWGGWCGPRWGGWCAPRLNWCAPRWGWGCRPWGWGCAPWYGATNWYGATTWGCVDSVYLSVPAGGGATFFSGSIVPFPVYGGWGYPATCLPGGYGWYGYPYGTALPGGCAPQFGPAGVLPFLGLGASTANANAGALVARAPQAARPVIAAAPQGGGRTAVVRASTGVARLRAARLVAVGDRHLREADGDPVRLTAALDAYRRAAGIAQDQPDIQLRQSLVLVALGRQDQADAAIGRAVAIDGRLAPTPVPPANGLRAVAATDPIFGDRPAGAAPPFAVRGAAILREIAAQAGDDGAGRVVATLADRWSQRFDGRLGALAADGAPAHGRHEFAR